MAKMTKMMKRIVFGSIMIAAMGALLYLDWRLERYLSATDASGCARSLLYGLPTAVVLAAVMAGGFAELSLLAQSAGARMLRFSGLAAAIALAISPYWLRLAPWTFAAVNAEHAILMIVSVALLAIFAEQMIRFRIEGAIHNIGATVLAVLYLGIGGALIFHIRVLGIGYLIWFLATVKCTDIGAYFTGSAIGRHKMIPWLSPGKTWEGLAGGVLLAGTVSALIAWSAGFGWNVLSAIALGAIVGVVGQFADLCESLMKRSAQIKDSGAVVPEFGGVLDIIDSPLLAAPVALGGAWILLT